MTAHTVHILHHGVSFCRMPGVPGEWPKGHAWIGLGDPERAKVANCKACLEAFERAPVIIGARASRFSARAIAGTKTIPCELCSEPTLFAPSSLERPEAAHAAFVCITCAASLGGQIQPMTGAQKAELSKAGIDAEAASKFVDALVEMTKK